MKPISTIIPRSEPIELIEYYEQFISYYPNCELETKLWFVQNIKNDWCVLDCGANIGYYSILFSRLAPKGTIYAFEPTSTVYMLRSNLAYHDISNVTIIESALADKKGLFVDDIYQEWGKLPLHQLFKFTTIDDFIDEYGLTRIDCIKIDVDSYDFAVLRGAKKTISRFNPYIMVELNHALNLRNENVIQALQWMRAEGYVTAEVYDTENFLFKRGDSHRNNIQFTICFPESEERIRF